MQVTLLLDEMSTEEKIQTMETLWDDLCKKADSLSSPLMISNIQLLIAVTKKDQEKLLPVINKNNLNLAPFHIKKIRRSFPVMCYFEIVN